MSFRNILARYTAIGGKKRGRDTESIQVKDTCQDVSSSYVGCLLLQLSGNTLNITESDISESFFDFMDEYRPKLPSSFSLYIHKIEEKNLDYRTGQLLIRFSRMNELKICCLKFIQDGYFRINKEGEGLVKISLSKVLIISENSMTDSVGNEMAILNKTITIKNIDDQGCNLIYTNNSMNQSIQTKTMNEVHIINHANISPSIAFNTGYSSISVVISHYKESLTWIPRHWYKFTHIYCKNNDINDNTYIDKNSDIYFEQLSNIGRESHTYLHHIITHYDNLTDIVYFTQANPFDHSPHFISLVDANIGIIQPYLMLGDKIHTIKNRNVSRYEHDFSGIQDGFHRTIEYLFGESISTQSTSTSSTNNSSSSSNSSNIGSSSSSSNGDDTQQQQQQSKRNKRNDSELLTSSSSSSSFTTIQFSPGAIMSVHRDCIRRRSKDYYERALKLLDYSINPIEGHAFERLWSLIFSYHHNNEIQSSLP